MAVTMESAIFMESAISKTIVTPLRTVHISRKQIFDIPAKLVTEQAEISRFMKNGGERIINLQRSNFQILYRGTSIGIRNLTKHGRKGKDE